MRPMICGATEPCYGVEGVLLGGRFSGGRFCGGRFAGGCWKSVPDALFVKEPEVVEDPGEVEPCEPGVVDPGCVDDPSMVDDPGLVEPCGVVPLVDESGVVGGGVVVPCC